MKNSILDRSKNLYWFIISIEKKFGIKTKLSLSDSIALRVLLRDGPVTCSHLAKKTNLKAASITNLIDRLEKKRVVCRVRSEKDRRHVLVKIKPGVLKASRDSDDKRLISLGQWLSKRSPSELALIDKFLKELESCFA